MTEIENMNSEHLLTESEKKELRIRLAFQKEEIIKSIIIGRRLHE